MIAKPLNFDRRSLSPYMSDKTLYFHYDKHYIGYINKVKKLIKHTDLEECPLNEILQKSNNESILNNAKQIINHEFFWNSLSPEKDQQMSNDITLKLIENFGSVQNFKDEFFNKAMDRYGSGWVWLYYDVFKKHLDIKVTKDTDTMLIYQKENVPLLVLDIWEHTYYLDYENEKSVFVKVFLDHLANWKFIEENLAKL